MTPGVVGDLRAVSMLPHSPFMNIYLSFFYKVLIITTNIVSFVPIHLIHRRLLYFQTLSKELHLSLPSFFLFQIGLLLRFSYYINTSFIVDIFILHYVLNNIIKITFDRFNDIIQINDRNCLIFYTYAWWYAILLNGLQLPTMFLFAAKWAILLLLLFPPIVYKYTTKKVMTAKTLFHDIFCIIADCTFVSIHHYVTVHIASDPKN